jgi:hypothetical protein
MPGKSGRVLISVIALFWGVTGPVADLNRTHIFNPAWTPHARFHNALGLVILAGLTALSLWLLWRRSGDRRTNLLLGTILGSLYFSAFFPAALVPGALLIDPGMPTPTVAGIPAQLILAAVSAVGVTLGYRWARGDGAGGALRAGASG